MKFEGLLILLLDLAFVCSQDPPCNEEAITGNGTDVSLAVTCSSFTPVVSYQAAGIGPGDGNEISVSIGYTCTNSTGAVIADAYVAQSLIAPTKTKTLPTSFTTGTECTFSGCYFLVLAATPGVYHSLAILPTPCTVDFDECLAGTHNCDVNAECVNTLGSYQCQCRFGFEGNGTQCTNIDECIKSEHNCSTNANCTDTEGNYNCTCETGYEGNGFTCTNIDECIESEHNCSTNANCTDTAGSYYCTCDTGYEGNGFTCTRIRECTEVCSENAVCVEGQQNYECVCKLGFTGDGITCNPITECLECDVNALCENTEDTYTCVCDEGYDGNGFTCSLRSSKDSKPWIPGLSSMAAVAVVIAVMALVVIFILGKRKSLCQIAECIGCTKKNDIMESFYNQEVDLDYIPVDPEKKPFDHICLEPPEILYRLEPRSIDEDTKRSTTCLTELITTNPSGQGDDQKKTPAWIIPIHASEGNFTSSTRSSNSTNDDSVATPKSASPSLDCNDNCETKLQFVRIKRSRMRTTALPPVIGDESGFVESDTEGYMYIPTSSSFSESDQKELSDEASV